MVPPWILVLLQPDLGTSLVLAAILAGMLFMSGASLRWLAVLAAVVIAALPIVWTYVLRDYQKQRLAELPRPGRGPAGIGLPAAPEPDRGRLRRPLRQGPHERDAEPARLPAGPDDRLRLRDPVPRSSASSARCSCFGLFVALIWRILLTAWRSQDPFGLVVAAGVASMLLFQLDRQRRDGHRGDADHRASRSRSSPTAARR